MSKFSDFFNSIFAGKSVEDIATQTGQTAESIETHVADETKTLTAGEAHSFASALVAFEHIAAEDIAAVAKKFIGLFHDDQVAEIDNLTNDADGKIDDALGLNDDANAGQVVDNTAGQTGAQTGAETTGTESGAEPAGETTGTVNEPAAAPVDKDADKPGV